MKGNQFNICEKYFFFPYLDVPFCILSSFLFFILLFYSPMIQYIQALSSVSVKPGFLQAIVYYFLLVITV